MNTVTIGIMAHVDVGKTTLSEGLLYESGAISSAGRVDHGDAYLDTYELEKKRGITIFSKQAVLGGLVADVNNKPDNDKSDDDRSDNNTRYVLIDTPGHVDLAPEMERVFSVLDYAVLVISATDGIQGHTRTVLKLLEEYGVPVFIFVNKMDIDGVDGERILEELKTEIGDECVDFSDTVLQSKELSEEVAMLDEAVMESYLETGSITDDDIRYLVMIRKLFPCYFGSALRGDGVGEFYEALKRYTYSTIDDGELRPFGARVFRISRDDKGNRLTHIRVTSGVIKPKQTVDIRSTSSEISSGEDSDSYIVTTEKIDQLRLYSGDRFVVLDEAREGDICAVTGLKNTYSGQGIGIEVDMESPLIEPGYKYVLVLPDDVSVMTMLPKMREFGQELPDLHIEWDEIGKVINIRVMGEMHKQILKEIIRQRFGIEVGFAEVQKDPQEYMEDEDIEEETDEPGESAEEYRLRIMNEALGTQEIDDILERAVASNKRAPRNSRKRATEKLIRRASRPTGAAKPRKTKEKIGDYILVDGYNVIHAWKELSALARDDMEQARGKLQDILCNYQGYRGGDVIVVFDAYRVAGHGTESFDYHNIHVVYTKAAETADQYIERFSVEKAERYHVTVVTSDGLEQIIIRGAGAHLLSARDFYDEVNRAEREMREYGVKSAAK